MAQVRVDFQERGTVEIFPRVCVQMMGDGVQLPLDVPDRFVPLGRYWRSKPFVFSLVPRCRGLYGSAKKTLRASRWPNGSPWPHLFPRITDHGFAQQRGHVLEFLGEALKRIRGIGPVHSGEGYPDVWSAPAACGWLTIGDPFDEVTIPMARHRAGAHIRMAFGPQRHSGALAAEANPLCPRPTSLACLTQHGQYIAGQHSAWQHIQPCINRFG